jgi:hypothetical protein
VLEASDEPHLLDLMHLRPAEFCLCHCDSFIVRHSVNVSRVYPYYPDSRLVAIAFVCVSLATFCLLGCFCHRALCVTPLLAPMSWSILLISDFDCGNDPLSSEAWWSSYGVFLRLCQSAVLQRPSPRPSLQAQPAVRELWRGIQAIDKCRPVDCPDFSGLWEKS